MANEATQKSEGEGLLDELLLVAGIPRKATFSPGEVQALLGISASKFKRMVRDYEPGPDGGPAVPDTLRAITLRQHRRVPLAELADFLVRNRTYDRLHALKAEREEAKKAEPRMKQKPGKRERRLALVGKPAQMRLFE